MDNILRDKTNFTDNAKEIKNDKMESLVNLYGDKIYDMLWMDFVHIMQRTPQYLTESLCTMYKEQDNIINRFKRRDKNIKSDEIFNAFFPKGNCISRTKHIYDLELKDNILEIFFSFIDYKKVKVLNYTYANNALGIKIHVYLPDWPDKVNGESGVERLNIWIRDKE